jgi:hypothetical protein
MHRIVFIAWYLVKHKEAILRSQLSWILVHRPCCKKPRYLCILYAWYSTGRIQNWTPRRWKDYYEPGCNCVLNTYKGIGSIALYRNSWSDSSFGPLIRWERAVFTHYIWIWLGSRAGGVDMRKNCASAGNRTPLVQSTASETSDSNYPCKYKQYTVAGTGRKWQSM